MKKKSGLLLTTAVIVILCLAVIIFTGQNKKTETEETNSIAEAQEEIEEKESEEESEEEDENVIVIEEGGSLVIPVSEVTTEASFFKIEVDGTRMEVIAVRGSDGSIRTAFNTCQVCYDSGRGYYVQQGDEFVCQNCGNRFTVDDIEIESGGCNPWPIFEEDKITTDESVEISYDFLAESKEIFTNWKQNY